MYLSINTYYIHTAEVWIKLLRIFELGLNFDLIFVESGAEPKTASAAQQRASSTRSTQQRTRGEILQKLRTEKKRNKNEKYKKNLP
jgi:hypothetical protein